MATRRNCSSTAPVGAWMRSPPIGSWTTGRSDSGMATNRGESGRQSSREAQRGARGGGEEVAADRQLDDGSLRLRDGHEPGRVGPAELPEGDAVDGEHLV